MSESLSTLQIKELFTKAFLGEDLSNFTESSYQFCDSVLLSNCKTDADFLDQKNFQFWLNYEFLYNIFINMSQAMNCGTLQYSHKNTWTQHFANIISSVLSTRINLVRVNGKVVSLVIGSLPSVVGDTEYRKYGIPQAALNYPTEVEDYYVPPACLSDATKKYSAVVISNGYLRINSLEYLTTRTSEDVYFLLNPAHKGYLTPDSAVSSNANLQSLFMSLQAEIPNVTICSDRGDLEQEAQAAWGRSIKHSVFIDSGDLNAHVGYLKIKVTADSFTMGKSLSEGTVDFYCKPVNVINKAKVTKGVRYDVAGTDGLFFTIEKTSANKEIREKAEATRKFRRDAITMLERIMHLISLDEFDSTGVEGFDPCSLVLRFMDKYVKNFDESLEDSIEAFKTTAAGSNWSSHITRVCDTNFSNSPLVHVFSTTQFCCGVNNIVAYDPSNASQRDLLRLAVGSLYLNDAGCSYERYASFGVKSLEFKLQSLLKHFSEKSRWTYFMRVPNASALQDFYLNNFIPNAEVETNFGKLADRYFQDSYSNVCPRLTLNYDITSATVVPDEILTISPDVSEFLRAFNSLKTYTELNNWWKLVKPYLIGTTLMSLRGKATNPCIKTLTTYSILNLITTLDTSLDYLESKEALS